MVGDGLELIVEEIARASNTCSWLGKSEDPTTPAGIVAKLGYDLFLTRGVSPTVWERMKASMRDEGVKEFIKFGYALILVAVLVWLGLKNP